MCKEKVETPEVFSPHVSGHEGVLSNQPQSLVRREDSGLAFHWSGSPSSGSLAVSSELSCSAAWWLFGVYSYQFSGDAGVVL